MKTLQINIDKAIQHHYDQTGEKLSITELAKMTGMTRQTLHNYKNGKVGQELPSLLKIAEITNYPFNELVTKL